MLCESKEGLEKIYFKKSDKKMKFEIAEPSSNC